jgi:hypothetical protein
MLELPHSIVGATIASIIPPPFSFPIALASHFATDLVPHWNPHMSVEIKKTGRISHRTLTIIVMDSTLALIFGLLFAFHFLPNINQSLNVIFCCFFAVVPDLVEFPHFFLKKKIPPIEKLLDFQKRHQFNVSIFPGLISQTLVILVCLYVISLVVR